MSEPNPMDYHTLASVMGYSIQKARAFQEIHCTWQLGITVYALHISFGPFDKGLGTYWY